MYNYDLHEETKTNKQTSKQEEQLDVLQAIDNFLLYMAIGYGVTWFVSIPFFRQYWDDPHHGGFFDHIGVVACVYTALVGLNKVSKLYNFDQFNRSINGLAYALLGFFLAFPIGGVMGASIVSVIVSMFAFKKAWDTSFITGALLGYWGMLLLVSGFEYNPFTKTDEGLFAMFLEGLAALVNMADYNVHKLTLTWFLLVPIGAGYAIYRTVHAVEVPVKKEEKEERKVEFKKEAVKEEVKVDVKVEQPAPPIVNDTPLPEQPKPNRRSTKKPTKEFFNITSPTTKVKLKRWVEEKIRNLSN